MDNKSSPQTNGDQMEEFKTVNGILYRIYHHPAVNDGREIKQVVTPDKLRRQVMALAHDLTMGARLGVKRNLDRIVLNFCWPGIHGDVIRFCRSCDMSENCSKRKGDQGTIRIDASSRCTIQENHSGLGRTDPSTELKWTHTYFDADRLCDLIS